MFKPPYENLGIGVSPYSVCCVFKKCTTNTLLVCFLYKKIVFNKQATYLYTQMKHFVYPNTLWGTPQSPNKKGRSFSSTINYLEYKYRENISISMIIIPYYNHFNT